MKYFALILFCLIVPCFAGTHDLYDPDRLTPWVDGQGYSSDAYSWWMANMGHGTKLYQNKVYTGQQDGEGGKNSFRIANAWRIQPVSNIRVGVVDTGVHPVGILANCVIGDDDVAGHGTRIASLVVASAPGTTILSRSTHHGEADIIAGMDWCRTNGAKIIVLAWGEGNSVALSNAISRCLASDVIVCCSVASGPPDYPSLWAAVMPNILPVSATDKQGKLYACSLAKNGVSAPGRNIPMQDLTEVRYGSGTSYAVGLAAGVAALTWSATPGSSATQVAGILRRNTLGLVKQLSPEGCIREAVTYRIQPEKLKKPTIPLQSPKAVSEQVNAWMVVSVPPMRYGMLVDWGHKDWLGTVTTLPDPAYEFDVETRTPGGAWVRRARTNQPPVLIECKEAVEFARVGVRIK